MGLYASWRNSKDICKTRAQTKKAGRYQFWLRSSAAHLAQRAIWMHSAKATICSPEILPCIMQSIARVT
jgi:hypothetical protein